MLAIAMTALPVLTQDANRRAGEERKQRCLASETGTIPEDEAEGEIRTPRPLLRSCRRNPRARRHRPARLRSGPSRRLISRFQRSGRCEPRETDRMAGAQDRRCERAGRGRLIRRANLAGRCNAADATCGLHVRMAHSRLHDRSLHGAPGFVIIGAEGGMAQDWHRQKENHQKDHKVPQRLHAWDPRTAGQSCCKDRVSGMIWIKLLLRVTHRRLDSCATLSSLSQAKGPRRRPSSRPRRSIRSVAGSPRIAKASSARRSSAA